MHITERHADKAGCHAGAGELYCVRVGSGSAGGGFDLIRHIGCSRSGHEAFENDRIDVGAASDNGAGAQFQVAVAAFVDVGMIGCAGDVQADTEVRIYTVSARFRASEANLFLYGGDGEQGGFGRFPGLGNAAKGLCGDVGAHFVVESAGDGQISADDFEIGIVGDGVADVDDFPGLLLVSRADVDPEFMGPGCFLAVVLRHQMDRFLAEHARYGS